MGEEKRPTAPIFHQMDKMIQRSMAAQVREAGLDEITMMHGWIIKYLYKNAGQDIYQRDIEKEFSIGRSAVTNILQLMEKKGYIARESVASDARLKRVVLTELGISHHEKMKTLLNGLDAELTRGIDQEEMEIFYQVIHKIKENLMKQMGENREEDLHASCIIERSKRV